MLVVDNISWPLPAGNYISGICNKLDTPGQTNKIPDTDQAPSLRRTELKLKKEKKEK